MDQETLKRLQASYTTVPRCEGMNEYGHGMSRRTVHHGTCCDTWAVAQGFATKRAYDEAQAQPVLDWLRAGNHLGYSGPFGDWWLYRHDHVPGQARMLKRESIGAVACCFLRDAGLIVAAERDLFAKIQFYDLAATPARGMEVS